MIFIILVVAGDKYLSNKCVKPKFIIHIKYKYKYKFHSSAPRIKLKLLINLGFTHLFDKYLSPATTKIIKINSLKYYLKLII